MAFNDVRMLENSLIYSPEVDVLYFSTSQQPSDVRLYFDRSSVCVSECDTFVCISHVCMRNQSQLSHVYTLPFRTMKDTGDMLWHVNMRQCVCVHQVFYLMNNRICRCVLLFSSLIVPSNICIQIQLQRSKRQMSKLIKYFRSHSLKSTSDFICHILSRSLCFLFFHFYFYRK